MTRAVSSPDGRYIAAVVCASQIHVSECPFGQRPLLCHVVTVSSRQAQKVLAHADMLRWSPEVYSTSQNRESKSAADPEGQLLRAWLLASDGQRLIVLCIDMNVRGSSETACTILADYDLGSHLGRFSFADFIFNHEHALLLQNVGIQGSIISLIRPERQDIMNIKFSDGRGLAMSPYRRCFAILTRSEGQDLVAVFTTTEMGSTKCITFSPLTYDAQGIKWCPESDPLLCIWDSATFGLKVSFFTANGHHLSHMGVRLETHGLPSTPTDFEGLGVNTLDWLSCDGSTVVSVFNSAGQLSIHHLTGVEKVRVPNAPRRPPYLRVDHRQLPSPMAIINHPTVIDGAIHDVWQESQGGEHIFSRHSAPFEPRSAKRLAGGDQVAMNANSDMVATKDSCRPWTLWIWDILTPLPLAVVNFSNRIKQLLWHPTVPEILVILTFRKDPLLYIWHAKKQQLLVLGGLNMNEDVETVDCEAKWLGGTLHEPPLFFLSSPHHYDAGIIDVDHDGVTFQSVFHGGELDNS
jgi:hypothetical protein